MFVCLFVCISIILTMYVFIYACKNNTFRIKTQDSEYKNPLKNLDLPVYECTVPFSVLACP